MTRAFPSCKPENEKITAPWSSIHFFVRHPFDEWVLSDIITIKLIWHCNKGTVVQGLNRLGDNFDPGELDCFLQWLVGEISRVDYHEVPDGRPAAPPRVILNR